MNEPRKHHYLPKFYLRNFASVDEKLMQADRTGRVFGTSVDDAGAIKDFHRLDYEDADEFAFEKGLASLEGVLAALLSRVLSSDRISETDRETVVFFAAHLRMRVPPVHKHVERLLQSAVRSSLHLLERQGALPSRPEGLDDSWSDSVNILIANWKCLEMMFRLAADEDHLAFLSGMHISLLRAPSDSYFLTSDQPVSIFEPYDTDQYAASYSPAVEFTLPLSAKLALQFRRAQMPQRGTIEASDITSDGVNEINRRTVIMADRWVFSTGKLSDLSSMVAGLAGQFAGFKNDVMNAGGDFFLINRTIPVLPAEAYRPR